MRLQRNIKRNVREKIAGDLSCSIGFTLLEMLAVMAIAAILLALGFSVVGKTSAATLTKSVYDFQGALQFARSYAVTHHTYVWVGYFEEDASNAGKKPAVSGVGRVAISIVASRDGTSIYNKTAAYTAGGAVPSTQTLDGSRLVQLGKLIYLNNVHVFTPGSSGDSFGTRPGNYVDASDRVGLAGAGKPLLFQFSYPLSGTQQYLFGSRGGAGPSGIVQFNPQGEAISETGPVPGVVPVKEIALQATNGTVPRDSVNVAAINISGLTGEPSIYRR